jgi:ribonuclease P protein component
MPLEQFTLSRNERLKSRKQIDLLFRRGCHINLFPLRASYLLFAGQKEEPLQFGIGVSGKWFKKAVDRNRIKRLAREAWRVQKNELRQCLVEQQRHMIIFVVFTGRDLPGFEMMSQAMSQIIEKLCRISNEHSQENT